MREHSVNQLNNFIMGFYIDDNQLIDEIIGYFEKGSDYHNEGRTYSSANGFTIDNSVKNSVECELLDINIFSKYDKYLEKCVMSYHEKHYYSDQGQLEVFDPPNIQKYISNHGHFSKWHCESGPGFTRNRHLVYMTYLNTLEEKECGETEFLYQNLKIRPEKGLTLIWPTAFTHTHRGLMPKDKDKLIMTGWLYDKNWSLN
jgi:prolyl 4-hydroxylase